ncbi:hypothetical protein GJ496_008287, partial [Pomphorhynchus laevis]
IYIRYKNVHMGLAPQCIVIFRTLQEKWPSCFSGT